MSTGLWTPWLQCSWELARPRIVRTRFPLCRVSLKLTAVACDLVQGLRCALDIDVAMVHLAALEQCAAFVHTLAAPVAAATRPSSPDVDASPIQISVDAQSLQPSPFQTGPGGSGFLSTSAHHDTPIRQGTPASGLQRLKSGGSLCTAASTVASLPGWNVPAAARWLSAAAFTLVDMQASVAVGPTDEVTVNFDGGASDGGRSCAVHSFCLMLNECPLVEAVDVELQISTTRKLSSGMDDLTAQVSAVPLRSSSVARWE